MEFTDFTALLLFVLFVENLRLDVEIFSYKTRSVPYGFAVFDLNSCQQRILQNLSTYILPAICPSTTFNIHYFRCDAIPEQ